MERNNFKSKRGPRQNRALRISQTRNFNTFSPPTYYKGKEVKMFQVALPASVSTAFTAVDMTATIIQGSNFLGERSGSSIELIGYSLDGTLIGGQSNNVADDKYNVFRIVVMDGTPSVPGLLTLTTSSQVGPRFNPGVVRVLHDHNYDLASPGPDSVGYMPPSRQVHISIRLHGICPFSGPGAATDGSRTITSAFVSDSFIGPNPGFVSGRQCIYYVDN